MTKKEIAIKNILEASLKEFASKGYELASTNTIYKEANVSKGAIFLYFNSKSELYYEVFKYYLKQIVDDMKTLDLSHINDVFDKMMKMVFWKYEYYAKKPIEAKFLIDAVSKPPEEVRLKIYSHMQELSSLSFEYFFNDIDYSQFSNEYTKEEIIKYIRTALNGIQATYIHENITFEYLESIRDESMKFLKTVLKGMRK